VPAQTCRVKSNRCCLLSNKKDFCPVLLLGQKPETSAVPPGLMFSHPLFHVHSIALICMAFIHALGITGRVPVRFYSVHTFPPDPISPFVIIYNTAIPPPAALYN
jgi:hypothetical protein